MKSEVQQSNRPYVSPPTSKRGHEISLRLYIAATTPNSQFEETTRLVEICRQSLAGRYRVICGRNAPVGCLTGSWRGHSSRALDHVFRQVITGIGRICRHQ